MKSPSVLVSADWDCLTGAQQECLRSVARATLGWGYRWGKEFSAEFAVSSARPEDLPAGVAMYNSPAPLRDPSPGDIVVLFLSPGTDPPIASAEQAAARGAKILAESHPAMAERFGSGVTMFTSPAALVESIYNLLESPVLPLISIVIFTYNGRRYLGPAIGSALGQSYNNFELIVIDDGSTDGTEQLVKSVASPRLRYVRQDHGGAPLARNRGIREAKGEFIVWLGSDDVLERECLSLHAGVLARYPSADVVYGNMALCDAGLVQKRTLKYDDWFGRNGELLPAIVRANVIPDGGTLIRKACYERIGPYDQEFPRAHDYEWWSRLAGSAVFKHNDAVVYHWRWHGGNLGAGSGKRVDMSYESRIVEGLVRRYGLEKLFPGPLWKKGKRDHAAALAHVRVAEILAGYGDSAGAIAHLEEGEKKFPLPEIRRAVEQLRRNGNRENQAMANTNSVEHHHVHPAEGRVHPAEGRVHPAEGRVHPAEGRVHPAQDRLSITYLITSILGVTGGNMTLLRQANALADRGHRVAIVTRSRRPSWYDIRAEVIHVAGADPMWRSVPPSDVVISTYFINAGELASVTAPVKVYFAQGDQFVFDDACASAKPDVRKLHAAMREMSRISYLLPGVRFVANSRALASRVEKLYARKADALLPVCVDQNVFAPLEKTPAGGAPRILIVGPDELGTEIEPLGFKGMADARRALELLRDSGEKFTAVRISNTPPLIFRGFPAEFHLAPSDEGKRMLFGTADMLVYASHYDSCPRPPLEAMASGAAVVCTATAGALEYCRDEENSLLVSPGAPEEIAGAVRRLMHDPRLRERLVCSGRETAARFPQEREWDELERLLAGYAGKECKLSIPDESPVPGKADPVAEHMRSAARWMGDGEPALALEEALTARESAASAETAPAVKCAVENFIGFCRLGLGDLELAKDAFSGALQADNSSSRACTGLGEVFRLAGLPGQARTMYEWALKNDPGNDEAKKGLRAIGADVPAAEEPPPVSAPAAAEGPEDITAVHADSLFARTIRELFVRIRPEKIVETGTFMGMGTTSVIAGALRDFALDDSVFYSIEVNPGLHGLAKQNLEKEGLLSYVTLLNGLSVPRSLLPTRDEIEMRTIREPQTVSLFVDHPENERVENYFRETDFPGVAEDLLGKVMGVFSCAPDFILLDSGGHMGYVEFDYVVGLLKGPCYVMLDDIRHVKHYRSFARLSADPRFEILTAEDEKAGFCLARFTPSVPAARAEKAPAAPMKAAPVSELGARLAIAGDLFGKKKFVEAIGALEGAENIIAEFPEAARQEAAAGLETFRGMSHLGLSDLAKAKGSFERALGLCPGSTQACAGLGEVLFLAGLDTEAKVMFEHAVALSAGNAFGASGLEKVNAALGLPADDNALLSSHGGRV